MTSYAQCLVPLCRIVILTSHLSLLSTENDIVMQVYVNHCCIYLSNSSRKILKTRPRPLQPGLQSQAQSRNLDQKKI